MTGLTDIRLVAVDMDGTLLDRHKTFDTQRFSAAMKRLRSKDIRFVAASGRQLGGVLRYFEGTDGVDCIAENGALIIADGKILAFTEINRTAVREAVAVIEQLPQVGCFACTVSAAYVLPSVNADLVAEMRPYYSEIRNVDSFGHCPEPILKLALAFPAEVTQEYVRQLRETLPPSVTATSSGFGFIDVVAAGVNKGVALSWLANRLGLGAENVAAIGDGGNDIEMLAYAGKALTVANGCVEVKAIADEVLGSNDEGGVIVWLETLAADG